MQSESRTVTVQLAAVGSGPAHDGGAHVIAESAVVLVVQQVAQRETKYQTFPTLILIWAIFIFYLKTKKIDTFLP